MTNIRHVDWHFNEFLAETATLDPVDAGIYAIACAMICRRGGPIERADLKRFVKCHGRVFDNALARLVAAGSLTLNGTEICAKWCVKELENARKRLVKWTENGAKGGRPSNKPNGLAEPGGFHARASLTTIIEDNILSQPSLSPSPARAREADPPEVRPPEPIASRAMEPPGPAAPAAPSRLAGFLEIPEDWLVDAENERKRLGLGPVDLRHEAEKTLAWWQEHPPHDPHAAWLGRARRARPDHRRAAVAPHRPFHVEPPPPGPPPPMGFDPDIALAVERENHRRQMAAFRAGEKTFKALRYEDAVRAAA